MLAVLPLHLDALLHLLQQAAPELLQLLRDRLHAQAADEAFEAGRGILEDVLCGVDVEDARVGFDRLEREVFREGRAVQEGAYLFLVNLAPLLELGDQRHGGLPLQPRLDREALLLEGLEAALEESIRNGKKGLAEGIIIFLNGLKGEKVLRAKQVRPDVGQPLQQVVLPPLDADFLFDGREGLEGKGGLEIADFSESALQVHARIFPLAGDPLGAEGVEAGEAGFEVGGEGGEEELLVGLGRGDERLGLLEMEAVALGGEAFELGVDLDEQFGLQFEVADGAAPAGWSGLETCGSHSIDYKVVNSHRNVYIMKVRTGCSRYRTARKAGGSATALRARQARRERSKQFSYFRVAGCVQKVAIQVKEGRAVHMEGESCI